MSIQKTLGGARLLLMGGFAPWPP